MADDLEALVRAQAQMLDLRVPEQSAPLVAAHLRTLLDMAACFAAVPLDPEIEPLPVFHP